MALQIFAKSLNVSFAFQPFMGPRYPPGGPRPGVRLPQMGNDFNGVSIKFIKSYKITLLILTDRIIIIKCFVNAAPRTTNDAWTNGPQQTRQVLLLYCIICMYLALIEFSFLIKNTKIENTQKRLVKYNHRNVRYKFNRQRERETRIITYSTKKKRQKTCC